MNPTLLLLIASLSNPPVYDVFAECDYGRVMASGPCQDQEQAAMVALQSTWDGYNQAKKLWCVQQVAHQVQTYHYVWLKACLEDDNEQPRLPRRVAPFWGPQPDN